MGEDIQPWRSLAPADVRLLLETGVPKEAISDDGVLDIDALVRLGWRVTDTELVPPDAD